MVLTVRTRWLMDGVVGRTHSIGYVLIREGAVHRWLAARYFLRAHYVPRVRGELR